MHCYAFKLYLKDGPLKNEFSMHCYAFKMYLKDGPQEGVQNALLCIRNVSQRQSLKEFRLFLC